ncbi:hypothetical protein F5878DRAFT_632757 [Lentinula raphanica]|uniref:Uncharacterized protein n=1 Tax=Lentinula raphanica TaxID=153919 RepID=A0AA38NZK8_9AGAR|nr:hypothetical protein F5878DRAFT_632757 [Lentinula raphanica]
MREIFFFFVTALQPGAGFFFVLSILSLRSPTHPSWIVLVSELVYIGWPGASQSLELSDLYIYIQAASNKRNENARVFRFLPSTSSPGSSFTIVLLSPLPIPQSQSRRRRGSLTDDTQTMRYDRTLIPFLTLSFALAAHSFPIPRPIPRPICSHDPNTDASTSTCTDTDTDTDIPLRFRRAAAAPTPNRRSSLDVFVPSDAADADKPLSPRLERRRKKRRGKGRNRPGNQQRGRQGSSAQGAPAVPVNGQASTPAPPSRPPPTMADSSTQVGAPSSNSASTSASAPSRGRPSNRAAAAAAAVPGPVKPSMVDASTQIHPSSFDNHSLSRSSSVSSVSSSRSDASYASRSSTSSANTDLADYETSEDHAGGGPKDHRVAAQLYQHSNIPGVLPPQKPHMPVGADDEEGGEGGGGGGSGGEGGDKKKEGDEKKSSKKWNKAMKAGIAVSSVAGIAALVTTGAVEMTQSEKDSAEAMQSNSDNGGSDSSLGSVSF